jgi:uncharacterized protein YfaS (alpha-2-macroglobulin family)
MKKITATIIMIFLFSAIAAAQDKFKALWLEVAKLEIENLPKSALKNVEEIHKKAVKENNAPQIIKSLFYKSKFSLRLEEDAQLKVINEFKKHISESNFPTRNLLENILANLYWQYFNQHRYKFYNRTKTESKVNASDFRTWDLNTLFKEIHCHFEASLENTAQLQRTKIYDFEAILQIKKESKNYRPTLYDFLANNALDFYKSSETSITRPSYKFTLDNAAFLGDAKTFSNLTLTTKDRFSLPFNALNIYQNLIKFHLKNQHLQALVAIDLHRIHFVNQHATFKNKEDFLLATLKTSQENYKKNKVSGLYGFEIAKIYNQKAKDYLSNEDKEDRFKNTDAIAICENIVQQFPKSKAAKNCTILKNLIGQKSIQITAEEYIPIDKNTRLLINYKNIDTLYFSSYKITEAQKVVFHKIYKYDEKIRFINALEKVKTWKATLRNENDFLPHSTEVVVPKFKNGNYLILASEAKDPSEKKIYGTAVIQVTNLTLIQNNFDGKYNYQIVDRNNGKPIKGAEIHLKNKKKRRGAVLNKKRITDKNGFASFVSKDYYQKVAISVKTKNDTATFGNHYLYENESNNKIETFDDVVNIKPFIFTDRAIYRPGQTVYFKAIVIKRQGDTSKVLKNKFIEISLFDVNHQIIEAIDLKLNKFGSVAGEFILPNNGLTGEFYIEVNKSLEAEEEEEDNKNYYSFTANNSTSISVEEYKRPKFKSEFKSVKETFKINDSIKINGFAKAFSGANITDAKVVYRVHRKVQYPNWYYWRRPNASSEAQEITQGESSTNAKGEFEIIFKAMPDKSVSQESLPIFQYEITADITDVNGETRSATTTVNVGYHSLLARVSLDAKIDKTSKNNKLKIETKNLNGEFVAAKGTLKIYKLVSPKKPQRKRVWAAPYYQDISENNFRKLFPNEPFRDEKKWKKAALIFNEFFDTSSEKEINLQNTKNWISGKYMVVLESKDKFGQAVKDQQKFSVFSSEEKTVADQKLFLINTDKTAYKVGDDIKLQIGSASKSMTVVVQIEKNRRIVKTDLIHLNNQTKILKIPVNKIDIGGFAIKYHYVNYNEFNSGNLMINVSEITENPIEIETNIFRDKLQPGQNETWSFTLKNDTNDKVSAEVLASMYDTSLDEFKGHHWSFKPIAAKNNYFSSNKSSANHSFKNTSFKIVNSPHNYFNYSSVSYDSYNWFGFRFGNNRRMTYKETSDLSKPLSGSIAGTAVNERAKNLIPSESNNDDLLDEISISESKKEGVLIQQKKVNSDLSEIKARKNFQETAFFYPQLRTDKNGQISFNFTIPEALTRWKLQLLAHTTDLKSATKTLKTVTQKELMVVPNAPRFLREGDQITLSAKISNLTNNKLSGVSKLILTDAITGKEINTEFGNLHSNKNFSVDKESNTNVSWQLSVPETVQAVHYKIVAKAGAFSDGEQNALPILTNRMLVTETMPMWVRSNQTKTFTLDKLKTNTSSTLKNHKLTLEMTSNPVWYAIQSLPYLMEYPYECAEQTFSRYYANTLARFVANSNPRIQKVFNAWKSSDALLSNLEKNQELKSLIIQETPWLRDAQSETEQKKRIALLFDLNKMKNEQEKAINKLQEMQMSSGGFPWFQGSRHENTYITQHIAAGFGHLRQLGVADFDSSTKNMLEKAIKFLDRELLGNYDNLVERANEVRERSSTKKVGNKKYKAYLAKNNIGYFTIQYLYMRSFYKSISLDAKTQKAVDYYQNQIAKYWNEYNLYAKGQIALSLFRADKKVISKNILKSLKENSITSDELGMYWKSNTAGYYYYQSPVETHALMIETFSEILDRKIHKDKQKTIDNLKIWLLKNKQTNRWKTTKATTEAVYALLLNGSDWVSITEMVNLKIDGKKIAPSTLKNVTVEAGTGYFKTSWNGREITPNMGKVTITKKGNGIAWGGLYWQYFEDLDKITSAETPLKLKKKLFLKINSDTGKALKEIRNETPLKVGDLISVRIELRADRNMEFIHMKDMRASGVEPVTVLSKYKWQDNLGYYESTKDAATNFFFDRLPKGVYVFEYDVRVNNAGNFSNGITTIQSMYAPEFSSHSKGIRINVK